MGTAVHRFLIAGLLAFGLTLASGPPGLSAEINDPGQGAVDLLRGRTGAFGLSGITHVVDDRYYAVSDQAHRLFALDIRIDRNTGRITESQIDKMSVLADARDTEGIALGGPESVWVCDEVGPAVREHRIDDGSVVHTLEMPSIFTNARRNYSLEALSIDSTGRMWFANEEALRVDGPKSSAERGSLVRLQRFDRSATDRDWVPSGQWAYQTDPIPGQPMGKFSRSGVVDLLALSTGPLLVLERGLGSGGIRSRIYSVDWSRATDTRALGFLIDSDVVPVQKRLLWEGAALGDNFEGMALGPILEAGDRSLILISDDGGATLPRLYALRIRLNPEPLPDGASAPPRSDATDSWPVAAGIAATLLLGAWALRTLRS
jgi:hypothetical protein